MTEVKEKEVTSVEVSKLQEKHDQLKVGLMSLKDEKENILKYMEELEGRILRTDGAIQILVALIQETLPPPEDGAKANGKEPGFEAPAA